MPKTVLITGTSTGFGLETASLFARQGWNVIATMRTPSAEHSLNQLPNVLVTRLDVEDRASIDHALTAGLARFGQLDVLINNAGFGLFGVFEATPREKLLEQFAVNVFGVMDVTRAVLPHFRARKAGVIVNVSSGAGVFTLPMLSAYSASKFALEGFSESLSYELAAQNIAVKIVEPGGVTSTSFVARSAVEAEQSLSIADYDEFVRHTSAVFDRLREARSGSNSAQVAQAIFEAANDTSNRLRYLATDDIAPLVRARRESSEQAYMALMRANFAPQESSLRR